MPNPFDQVDPEAYHRSRSEESLPDTLPGDPFTVFQRWFDEARARKVQPNPNAMTLATAHADGTVSARVVLCKGIDAGAGYVVFYTNYESRKGVALRSNASAAAVFHWDGLDRQVRIEGLVGRSPAAESDAYFASRPWESRVAAWASAQSRPVESREQLLAQVMEVMERLGVTIEGPRPGVTIPRPPNWGGYRLYARRVELWVAGTARVHDRALWERDLRADGAGGFEGGPWRSTRLQP